MSDFRRFYKENVKQADTKKYIEVTDRITNEDGTPVKWVLQPLRKLDSMNLADKHFPNPKAKQDPERSKAYLSELIGETVIFPNLNDSELQDSYGVMGALNLLNEMLPDPVEFNLVLKEVNKINGFAEDINELKDEAKN